MIACTKETTSNKISGHFTRKNFLYSSVLDLLHYLPSLPVFVPSLHVPVRGFDNWYALASDFLFSANEIGKSSRMGEPQHIGYILATTWAEFGIQLASFKIPDTTYTANGCASSTNKDVGGVVVFPQLSSELQEFQFWMTLYNQNQNVHSLPQPKQPCRHSNRYYFMFSWSKYLWSWWSAAEGYLIRRPCRYDLTLWANLTDNAN